MVTRAPFLEDPVRRLLSPRGPRGGCRAHPCRAGHAVRRIHAPLLAAGLLFRRAEGPAAAGSRSSARSWWCSATGAAPSGLLELHCPHRGTSLEFGLIGAKGIRCCYHGWLFDVGRHDPRDPGRAGGQHAEGPALSRRLSDARVQSASSSPIWARPTQQPSFPVYDSFTRPGYRLMPGRKYFYPCNWLQILENAMDPVAYGVSPHDRQRRGVHRRIRRDAGTGVRRDAGRHDLHRHPAGRRQRLGADGRERAAQPAAGRADLGRRPPGASVQRPDDEPLDRAASTTPTRCSSNSATSARPKGSHRRGGPTAASCCPAARRRHLRGKPAPPRRLRGAGLAAADRDPWPWSTSARPIAGSRCSATRSGAGSGRSKRRRAQGLCRDAGAAIPTYCNDTVVRVPPAEARPRIVSLCARRGGGWPRATSSIRRLLAADGRRIARAKPAV